MTLGQILECQAFHKPSINLRIISRNKKALSCTTAWKNLQQLGLLCLRLREPHATLPNPEALGLHKVKRAVVGCMQRNTRR